MLSSVALFKSHVRVPSTEGPILRDTQFGSIKHFTRQLPSSDTFSVLITWPVSTLLDTGSLNIKILLYSVDSTARKYTRNTVVVLFLTAEGSYIIIATNSSLKLIKAN